MLKEKILFEKNIKPVDKLLYLALGIKGEWNVVEGVPVYEFCKGLNVSERTLLRSLKSLESNGYIEKIKGRNSIGQHIPNTYKILK